MIIFATAVAFALLLFWFGFNHSHAVAPAVLFAATAPVVAIFSLGHGPERIAAHLIATLFLFYVAFALGRWAASAWRTHGLPAARRLSRSPDQSPA